MADALSIQDVLKILLRLGLNRSGGTDTKLRGGPYDGFTHSWYVGRVIVLPCEWKRWAVYVVDSRACRMYEPPGGKHPGPAIFKGFASSEKKGKAEVLVEEEAT